MLIQRARDNLCAVAFCNLVGGQDELVFDGHSLVVDHEGTVLARAPQFEEALTVCTVDLQAAATARLRDTRLRPPVRAALPEVRRLESMPRAAVEARAPGGPVAPLLEPEAEVYAALCVGTRDYMAKNGFERAVLGLSGGIDSTLVLLVAVDALGADRVTAVVMPSRYSSEGTQSDARLLAANLGVDCLDIPIAPAMERVRGDARRRLRGPRARHHRGEPAGADPREPADGAVEQVRLARADDRQQVGELRRLLDAVRRLGGRVRGHQGRPEDARLPARRLPQRARRAAGRCRARSSSGRRRAELRPDQKDADSLPDYDTLDAILEAYIEEDAGREQLDARGAAGRGGRARLRAGRPGGVQAAPGAAGDQDHATGVRARPADADHERLPHPLGANPRRLSPSSPGGRTRRHRRVAERQHGNVTRAQLREHRFTPGDIEERELQGWLIRHHKGVYALGHVPRTRESRWAAAVLALGAGAVLSHVTAAVLWRLLCGTAITEVTVPTYAGRPRRDGIVVHRQRLPANHVTVHRGIPVTTPIRTLLDLAAVLSLNALAASFEQAQVVLHVPPAPLAAEVISRPRHRGNAKLRRILEGAVDPADVRSVLELRFLRLCAAYGIPRPEVNFRIGAWTPDFLWLEQRVIVETDGYEFHRTAAAKRRDAAKDEFLRGEGFTVVRLTWADVTERPATTAAQGAHRDECRLIPLVGELTTIVSLRSRPARGAGAPPAAASPPA